MLGNITRAISCAVISIAIVLSAFSAYASDMELLGAGATSLSRSIPRCLMHITSSIK